MNYYGRELLKQVCPRLMEILRIDKHDRLCVRKIKTSDIQPDQPRSAGRIFRVNGDVKYTGQDPINHSIWLDNHPATWPAAIAYY